MNKNLPICMLFFCCSFIFFFSSSSWFSIWVSMELNTMMFICLLFNSNKQKMESVMSYFIIQSVSSLFLLFSFLSSEIWTMIMSSPSLMMLMAISLKLGSAPFHSWFIPMAFMITNKLFFWMALSIQKLIPLLMLLLNVNKLNYTLMLFIILCVSLGSSLNIMNTSMKMMIILSSLSNMGWLLMSSVKKMNMENYLMVYTIMTAMMIPFMANKMKTHMTTKQASTIMLMMAMLGSVPPLMGFMPKLMISMSMMEMELFLMLVLMLLFSSLDMFVYARMSFMSSMMSKTSLFWEKLKKNKTWTFITMNTLTTLVWL